MAQGIAGTIEAWRFAVPEANNSIAGEVRASCCQLRTHDCGRSELLVDGRLMDHVESVDDPQRSLNLLVEPAEWRAGVTREEGGRSVAEETILSELIKRQSAERLYAA